MRCWGTQQHEVLGHGRLRRRWRANVRERWLGASDRQRQGYSASQQQVVNHCGGVAISDALAMVSQFSQRREDRTGLGFSLSIARQGLEANGGTLTVRDKPAPTACSPSSCRAARWHMYPIFRRQC